MLPEHVEENVQHQNKLDYRSKPIPDDQELELSVRLYSDGCKQKSQSRCKCLMPVLLTVHTDPPLVFYDEFRPYKNEAVSRTIQNLECGYFKYITIIIRNL